MASACGVLHGHIGHPPLPSSLSRCLPPPSPKPPSLSFLSSQPTHLISLAAPRRPLLHLRASAAAPPSPPRDEALKGAIFSLLRPVSVALAMGAALLLARLHRPPFAIALASAAHPAAEFDAATPSPPPVMDDGSGAFAEEENERTLEEHLESHPDDAGALRTLMKLKIRAEKPAEAIAIVDRLILLEPADKGLPLLRAHLQSHGGDAESARQLFEEMLQWDPFFVEAYHGLVVTALRSESEEDLAGVLERIEGAMEVCRKQKRKEELRDFKLLVAQVKVLQGDYGQALGVYQELVKEEPRDFRPYLCQGIIYALLRRKDEAEEQFRKYRRLVPKGHPYAQYFDENMVFSEMDGSKRTAALKR